MNKKNIKIIIGNTSVEKILNEKPFEIFSEDVIKLFSLISKDILNYKKINSFPDLASYGFFCREINLNSIKKKYHNHTSERGGRGLALHFTPSNVPLNFAYSLFFSLITGNATIIRIGKNNYEQTKIFLNFLKKRLDTNFFKSLSKKVLIINYEKNNEINNYLSKNCEIRIIWGGDNSINEIRKSKIEPHAYELTFPDRYSLCIISSSDYLNSYDPKNEAIKFYNDTLTFDQNACTSPRLIIWNGTKQINSKARLKFWKYYGKIVKNKKYLFKEGTIIQKIKSQYSSAIELGGKNPSLTKDNYIKNSIIKNFPNNLENFNAPGGFFLEYYCSDLNIIKKKLSTKIQTITSIGFSTKEIAKKIDVFNSKGVFRVVPNGQSSNMDLIWDGYEIIFQMSKKINLNL
tara:strand:- start:354 stop:1562 length:1209 start_codon:yes stop_codon:yes gene_type:complete